MLSQQHFKIILIVFIYFLGNLVGLRLVEAADWSISPDIRSASISAIANHSFGGGPGNRRESVLDVPALFPEKLETGVRDRAGNEREASGIIGLEINEGAIHITGRMSTKDSDPNDFIAPIATIRGRVKFDLMVILSGERKNLRGKLLLSGKGAPSLVGEVGKIPPTNIVIQVWLNEQALLKTSDFLLGEDKVIPKPLHHGDIITILFQGDFSLFSKGEADIVSTLHYSFGP
ncbi:MAG: hypothetical protein ABGX83_06735 [Nitrospira sp.]|nr:hypothetical protein [Candidatus Manganitrophaceae bacterium]HIL35275.1 hypothetical protein [Candidatus Manganitrophaceae bacterium]